MKLKGSGASGGIAAGRVWKTSGEFFEKLSDYTPGTKSEEAAKIGDAMRKVAARLTEEANAAARAGKKEESDILTAESLIAEDSSLMKAASRAISEGKGAPFALLEAAKENAGLLSGALASRAADVIDAGRALAAEILGVSYEIPKSDSLILAGDDVSPILIIRVPEKQLAGIVIGGGSSTGHAAILARTRGIPAVTGLGDGISSLEDGSAAIINGDDGTVTADPDESELAAARKAMEEAKKKSENYMEMAGEALTKDGCRIFVRANASSPEEAESAAKSGMDGIGLLRSEFLFSGGISENEMTEKYSSAVRAAGDNICVIRTMDSGGDKKDGSLPAETNPFLGIRGIRLSLKNPDGFKSELRAAIRAAKSGKAAIMIPMVADVSEIKTARKIFDEAKSEILGDEENAPDIPFGIMIETPAAAQMAKQFAKYSDFFSIGTNDLAQYALAADRNEPYIDKIGGCFHPAVISIIASVAKAAADAKIPCSVCGEAASDPLMIPLFIAMGISSISVAPPFLGRARAAVRNASKIGAKLLLSAILSMEDASEIRDHLKNSVGL